MFGLSIWWNLNMLRDMFRNLPLHDIERADLHQSSLAIPAIQEPGVHLALTLDIDGAAFFKHE